MKVTNVFTRNKECNSKIVVNRGGARSSKSYSIIQLLSVRFATEKKKKILILRKTLPSLRISTLPVFKEVWAQMGIDKHIQEQKMDLNYYLNDNWLHFGSLDDPSKIKSSDWTEIFMEEATEFSFEDYMILKLRLSAPIAEKYRDKEKKILRRNQLFLSLNPVDIYHWIKTEVVDKEKDCTEILSTFIDNPFLDRDYIDSLLAVKDQNFTYWQIYALGLWGRLEELIFNNWIDIPSLPDSPDVFYGCDFGFNNPSCLIEVRIVDDEPYVRQLLYESKLTNSQLIAKIETLIPDKNLEIYCDSAEPARIKEICDAGFNAMSSDKKVSDGLNYMKTKKIHVTEDSPEIWKEYRGYSYKKKGVQVLDEPVSINDHAMAAIRYALYTRSQYQSPRFFSVRRRR